MANLKAIRNHIIILLTEGLSKDLTYHDLQHTLDVTAQCMEIARDEQIQSPAVLEELEIACLYHDIGFIYVYKDHEEKGCEIAREQLPGFGLTAENINNICALIMATKVPQQPKNDLQKIICDADLDYFGRPDFFENSDKLRRELLAYNLITDDHAFEERQISFLKSHEYFTESSRKKRTPAKLNLLNKLIAQKILK
ncbi:hypothetical protein BH11BAC3_BH11BAC3_12730 [soil metagenome]